MGSGDWGLGIGDSGLASLPRVVFERPMAVLPSPPEGRALWRPSKAKACRAEGVLVARFTPLSPSPSPTRGEGRRSASSCSPLTSLPSTAPSACAWREPLRDPALRIPLGPRAQRSGVRWLARQCRANEPSACGPGPRAQRSGVRWLARQCRANEPSHPQSRLRPAAPRSASTSRPTGASPARARTAARGGSLQFHPRSPAPPRS